MSRIMICSDVEMIPFDSVLFRKIKLHDTNHCHLSMTP